MRTAPPSLGTTTIAGVGVSTGDITPRPPCVVTLHVPLLSVVVERGALRAKGLAFGLSLILYSCVNVPSPVNKEGYCDNTLF